MQMHRRADKSGTTEIFTGTRKRIRLKGTVWELNICAVWYIISVCCNAACIVDGTGESAV